MLKNRHRIEVVQGDITLLKVDVIVNAANNTLLGGGGVDGAIHRAAGPSLVNFCSKLQGCPTGSAKLTPGFSLPARAIIHTVGPRFNHEEGASRNKEAELLANCYRSVLKIAADEGFLSIAFPAISCGAYGYPVKEAVDIAVREVDAALNNMPLMQRVIFCCFNDEITALYKKNIEFM
jgi:O-acetyl-ADP-ribose deacetylase (regulator of RNase III)